MIWAACMFEHSRSVFFKWMDVPSCQMGTRHRDPCQLLGGTAVPLIALITDSQTGPLNTLYLGIYQFLTEILFYFWRKKRFLFPGANKVVTNVLDNLCIVTQVPPDILKSLTTWLASRKSCIVCKRWSIKTSYHNNIRDNITLRHRHSDVSRNYFR